MDTNENPRVMENAELHSLYLSSKNWLSDIAFYEDELKFFKRQIYKIYSITPGNMTAMAVNDLNSIIRQLETKKNRLLSKIFCYQSNLTCTLQELMNLSVRYLKEEHLTIQNEVNRLHPTLDIVKSKMHILLERKVS